MSPEQQEFFTQQLKDRNYLGAAQYIKELGLDKARLSALSGRIIGLVIEDLASARSRNDREKVVFLRSVLAWLLRDYPGLAPLYREQLRLANGGGDIIPELSRGFRNVGDVLSGKKTVQEGVEDASEPLESFADQAGNFIRDGLNQMGEFFANLNKNMEPDRQPGASSARSRDTEQEDEDMDDEPGRKVDINIEDADDPLPHDIHDASPNDRTRS